MTFAQPRLGGLGLALPLSSGRRTEATLPLATAPARGARRASLVIRASEGGGIGGFFKKLQGAVPIVGVVSRLTADGGGFDKDLSYQEFCRKIFNDSPLDYRIGVEDLEKTYGTMYANEKNVNFCLWLASEGTGRVLDRVLCLAARRVRYSNDLEYEVGRFLAVREEEVQRYQYLDFKPNPEAAVNVAVQCVGECVLGVQAGEAILEDDVEPVAKIVGNIMPGATFESARAAIAAINAGAAAGEGAAAGGGAAEGGDEAAGAEAGAEE